MAREGPETAVGAQSAPGKPAPGGAEEFLARAGLHHRAGRLTLAESLYAEAMKRWPGLPEPHRRLGKLCLESGRTGEAVEHFAVAALLAPANAIALAELGMAYLSAERLAEAADALRRALALRPELGAVHFHLGNLQRRLGAPEEAVASYRRAIALSPAVPHPYINLGITLQEMMEYDEAVAVLRQAAAMAPRSFEAHYNLGVTLAAQRRDGEAIAAYRAALALDPRAASACLNLGSLLQVAGKLEEAVALYERAVALAPGLAQAHVNLGTALHARGDMAEGAAAMRRALALDPRNPQIAANLAQMLRKTGEVAGAEAAFRQALALDPAHAFAKGHFSIFLQQVGKREEALALLDYARLLRTRRIGPLEGWPSVAAFNADVARHIYGHPTLMPDPPGKAIRNGRQTLEILDGGAAAIVALRRFFEASVADYIATALSDPGIPFAVPPPAHWHLEAWAVILRSSGYQLAHCHPGSLVSGVYYVQVPAAIAAERVAEAGFLKFGEPLPETLEVAPPEPLLTTAVKPEAGMLVLFPSSFWHRVIAFEGEEDRICIAFDVVPAPAAAAETRGRAGAARA
jgi:tetratricopeptide (TPR) repeat protein